MMLVMCDNHHPRQPMQVVKNGETVEISPIAEVRGDIYRCPTCGNQVITDFGDPQPRKTTDKEVI